MSNQRINGNTGIARGKSTPVMNSSGNSNVAGGVAPQQKGNSNNLSNKHPAMVGASTAQTKGAGYKARSAAKSNKTLPLFKVNDSPVSS